MAVFLYFNIFASSKVNHLNRQNYWNKKSQKYHCGIYSQKYNLDIYILYYNNDKFITK